MYICLWGDHFSDERIERKVMVVMRMCMRICPHCTIDLRDNWSVGLKGECCTTLARLRSMINITGRLHFPEHEDDCMKAYPISSDIQPPRASSKSKISQLWLGVHSRGKCAG